MLTVAAQLLRGFCMGAADIVPGVSGGTVALVFGIYERLVHNIRTGAGALGRAARLDPRGAVASLGRVEWMFLLPLLGGIGLAILTLSHLIERLLDERPVETAAVFFGLVAASIIVAWGHLGRRDGPRLAALGVAAVATFAVLGLRTGTPDDPALVAYFGAGALAVCAMILPGISGSFILLMIGMYDSVLGAVNDRDLAVVAAVAAGCVLGLAAFSSLLDWLLARHHDTVIAALIGIMVGSLRVLWPWPAGTENARLAAPPGGEWVGPLLLAVVAGAVVLGLAGISRGQAASMPHGARTPV